MQGISESDRQILKGDKTLQEEINLNGIWSRKPPI